jgi:hypothetical protein
MNAKNKTTRGVIAVTKLPTSVPFGCLAVLTSVMSDDMSKNTAANMGMLPGALVDDKPEILNAK